MAQNGQVLDFKRDNDSRIREAAKNGTKVYALVRNFDCWVHTDSFWRINVYTEEEVKSRKPNSSWRWKEINPDDPTKGFACDERGTFWDLPRAPYEGR